MFECSSQTVRLKQCQTIKQQQQQQSTDRQTDRQTACLAGQFSSSESDESDSDDESMSGLSLCRRVSCVASL